MTIKPYVADNDNDEFRFYVYAWLYPDGGQPFYVGKGCGKRDVTPKRNNRFFKNIVAKVRRAGGEPCVVRWHDGLREQDAHTIEVAYIKLFGRRNVGTGILCNLTDGGEGASGTAVGDETRTRMSDAQRRRFVEYPALRERAREVWLCRKHSDEAREKMRVSQSSRSRETLEKLSASLRGRTLSDAHRAKLSAAARNRSPETIAKMSAWERTPEIRAKMSEAGRGRAPTDEHCAKLAKAGRMKPPKEGYKGVSFDKARAKWFAKIESEGKQRALGRYFEETDAARAYDKAAIAAWGLGNCWLNFPQEYGLPLVADNDNDRIKAIAA